MALPLRGSDAISAAAKFWPLILHHLTPPPSASMKSEGQAVRIVPGIVVLSCLMLACSSGCQLFNKKSSGPDTPFLGAKEKDSPKFVPSSDPLIGGPVGPSELEGLLAGRVIDGSGRPADAQIRWICLDNSKEEETPLEVAVNGQGYFMIQGLKSGKHYKLVTHAKSGEKTVEVVTLTKAPNVHLLIHVNENFIVPSAPEKGKGSEKNKKSAGAGKEQPASAQFPIPLPGWPQQDPAMLPPSLPSNDKSRIAEIAVVKPPMAKTPGPAGNSWQIPGPGTAVPITTPVVPPPSLAPSLPVPSSLWIGSKLENFALFDTNFQPWELRKHRRGNLVLLDFWKTNCVPCLQTIPNLCILQSEYGSQGFEVVGIAYEDGGVPSVEQARMVATVAQRRNTNYQLLLGSGAKCPLKRDLRVQVYPTLILVDENGVYRVAHEGLLDGATLHDLEFAIKRRVTQY